MSTHREAIAREKQALVDRSALFRLRLRQDAGDVRKALQWTRIAAAVAPRIGRFFVGIALAGVISLVRARIRRA